MNSGVLQFSLGLEDTQFTPAMLRAMDAVNGVKNKTLAMASGLTTANGSMIGMRSQTEILRHSLDSMGGSFGSLGSLARLALDPMTLGFAAGFAAVQFFNKSLEESQKRMKDFFKEAISVEAIIEGIISARPTDIQDWVKLTEQLSKIAEMTTPLKGIADSFNDVQKGVDENNSSAADEQIAIEQEKIELLERQGKICAADAVKRIEALKEQAILQKNLNERTGIKNEISRRQSDLAHVNELTAKSPSVKTAIVEKNKADNTVTDLKKQLEDLPKAIAENQKVIKTAEGNAKRTSYTPEKGDWYLKANIAKDRGAQLQGQLKVAQAQFPGAVKAAGTANENFENAKNYKGRKEELNTTIIGLQNKLGVTVDRQRKMTPLEIEKSRLDSARKIPKPENQYKPQVTSFEKMGFVMGGSNNALLDVNKRMASGIDKTNALLQAVGRALGLAADAPTTNQI
jgi:hypothetical protein